MYKQIASGQIADYNPIEKVNRNKIPISGQEYRSIGVNSAQSRYRGYSYIYIRDQPHSDADGKYDVTYRFILLTVLIYGQLYSSNVEWIIN